MKAYQIKIGKRGEQVAQMFIVEAYGYRHAIVQGATKWASITGNPSEEAVLFDLQFIEEVKPVKTEFDINCERVSNLIQFKNTIGSSAFEQAGCENILHNAINKLQGKELTEDIPTGEILATKEMQDKLKEVNECLSKDGNGERTLEFRDGGAALLAGEKVANKDNTNYVPDQCPADKVIK
jgi:hypothetical protein